MPSSVVVGLQTYSSSVAAVVEPDWVVVAVLEDSYTDRMFFSKVPSQASTLRQQTLSTTTFVSVLVGTAH